MNMGNVSRYCLFCANPCFKRVANHLNIDEQENSTSYSWSSLSFLKGKEAPLVKKQLKVWFILRNILNIMPEKIGEFLNHYGAYSNPEDWITVCEACGSATGQYYKIMKEVNQANNQLTKMTKKYNKILRVINKAKRNLKKIAKNHRKIAKEVNLAENGLEHLGQELKGRILKSYDYDVLHTVTNNSDELDNLHEIITSNVRKCVQDAHRVPFDYAKAYDVDEEELSEMDKVFGVADFSPLVDKRQEELQQEEGEIPAELALLIDSFQQEIQLETDSIGLEGLLTPPYQECDKGIWNDIPAATSTVSVEAVHSSVNENTEPSPTGENSNVETVTDNSLNILDDDDLGDLFTDANIPFDELTGKYLIDTEDILDYAVTIGKIVNENQNGENDMDIDTGNQGNSISSSQICAEHRPNLFYDNNLAPPSVKVKL